jgi:hypothetical protein
MASEFRKRKWIEIEEPPARGESRAAVAVAGDMWTQGARGMGNSARRLANSDRIVRKPARAQPAKREAAAPGCSVARAPRNDDGRGQGFTLDPQKKDFKN